MTTIREEGRRAPGAQSQLAEASFEPKATNSANPAPTRLSSHEKKPSVNAAAEEAVDQADQPR